MSDNQNILNISDPIEIFTKRLLLLLSYFIQVIYRIVLIIISIFNVFFDLFIDYFEKLWLFFIFMLPFMVYGAIICYILLVTLYGFRTILNETINTYGIIVNTVDLIISKFLDKLKIISDIIMQIINAIVSVFAPIKTILEFIPGVKDLLKSLKFNF